MGQSKKIKALYYIKYIPLISVLGSRQAVIRQFYGSHKAVVRQPLVIHHAVIWHSSGIIRQLSERQFTVYFFFIYSEVFDALLI
jgi:hypothetical protein